MRQSIIDALKRFEAENATLGIKGEIAYRKLRAELVEKYGEEGVDKVDRRTEREWNEQHRI
jgi:hypothetical protein